MANGFATDEFLDFSRPVNLSPLKEGVTSFAGNDYFPYRVLLRSNALFPDGAPFFISPICLSGPSSITPITDIDCLKTVIDFEGVSGGFLQTRYIIDGLQGLLETSGAYCFFDSRTNYRMMLGDSPGDLFTKMKTDCRSRCKKLFEERDLYEIKKVDREDTDLQSDFASMYLKSALRLNFADLYKFEEEKFQRLFESTHWQLYLLYYNDEVISGSVLCQLDGGYDYTFMAAREGVKDAGRANLFFLYNYLSENETGYLDLGGGISENDSLARFKLGMGSEPVQFLRARFVYKGAVPKVPNETIEKYLSSHWP